MRFAKRAKEAIMSGRAFSLAFAFGSLAFSACSRAPAAVDAPKPAVAQAETPPDAHDAADAADAASGKPFGAVCTQDAECAQRVCFHKRIKGADSGPERRDVRPEAEEHEGYCSIRCTTDADCPTPLTRGKCGARGMCKRAE
jgi:hypothetical protein